MTKQTPSAKKKIATIGSRKPRDSGKKAVETTDQRRASWAVYEEFDLLDMYAKARNNPSLTADKGMKSKAWRELADVLNSKHRRTLEKAQYKSKLDRIMRDYDSYNEIKGLSGVGVCIHTGKLTFPDDVWDALIESKPKKQRSKIIQLHDSGFEHEVLCSMIAGDLRATGSEANSIDTLLARLRREEDASHASPQLSSDGWALC
ncbi:hypothetical protein PR003_g8914 [Phytophthora rubi]|uniref:Myb/SANT-like domain-containing protein n=1 Tax=Phytophthora rubi TaxID=129364 RepID=A0A6A4FI69_9STRA|nr:hypothetical protein PR002_g8044 [Phytophthora rubi]KAE9051601.1 hypothetical protein PR001_g1290 [Phytophthora rubi]KAE9343564.1 hypothetical protein PR003_g8914 [Phytophthora rubi]